MVTNSSGTIALNANVCSHQQKPLNCLFPRERIGKRVTRIRFEGGGEHDSIDAEEWRGNTKALKGWWTGASSIFEILGEDDIPIPIEVHDPISSGKKRREKVLKQQGFEGYGIFIECCCDPNSGLGAVSGRIGVKHIRMTEDFGNLCDENVVDQLLDRLKEPEYAGVDLWGSLPCKPWTNWQQMNIWRYGKPYLREVDEAACSKQENAFVLFENC